MPVNPVRQVWGKCRRVVRLGVPGHQVPVIDVFHSSGCVVGIDFVLDIVNIVILRNKISIT